MIDNFFGDMFFDEVVILIGFFGMLLFVLLGVVDVEGKSKVLYEFVYGFVFDIVG